MEGLKAHEGVLVGENNQTQLGYAPDIISGYKGNKIVSMSDKAGSVRSGG